MRRLKRYMITQHGLRMLFEQGASWFVREGVPEGAVVAGVVQDPVTNVLNVFFEHESFDMVADGYPVPEGLLIFTKPEGR